MAMIVIGTTRVLQSENNNRFPLRDASFCSYHNSTEYVKKVEDGEIDVFQAEKYFNGSIDEQRSKLFVNEFEEIKPEYVQLNLPRVRFETRSVGSESSWNSSGLLLQRSSKNYINEIHDPLPAPPPRRRRTNKWQIKNLIISTLIFGCKYCSCNRKKSVDIVNERTTQRRSVQPNKKSPRKNPWHDKMERKTSLEGSPVQRMPIRSIVDDETCSDASSDLFEIASLATSTNTNTNSNHFKRRGSDGTNTPRDYAPPSEAMSVDWSVVTASAADISDFDDMRTMSSFCSDVRKLSAGERNDRVPERRRSAGILSGHCKSYMKSVRDGYYKGRKKKMGSRFGAEGKLAGQL